MSTVLVVDLARVLDESALGKEGAAALQARFDDARAQHEKLRARGSSEKGRKQADEAALAFEADKLREIEEERARLRDAVLAKVRPLVSTLMSERKADVVIDAAVCLAIGGGGVDVTDEIIQRLART